MKVELLGKEKQKQWWGQFCFGEGTENSIGCKTYKIISQILFLSEWAK